MSLNTLQKKMLQRYSVLNQLKDLDRELKSEVTDNNKSLDYKNARKIKIQQTRRVLAQQKKKKQEQFEKVLKQKEELIQRMRELKRMKIRARLQEVQSKLSDKTSRVKRAEIALNKARRINSTVQQSSQILSNKSKSSSSSKRVTLDQIRRHAKIHDSLKKAKLSQMESKRLQLVSSLPKIKYQKSSFMRAVIRDSQKLKLNPLKKELLDRKKRSVQYASIIKDQLLKSSQQKNKIKSQVNNQHARRKFQKIAQNKTRPRRKDNSSDYLLRMREQSQVKRAKLKSDGRSQTLIKRKAMSPQQEVQLQIQQLKHKLQLA